MDVDEKLIRLVKQHQCLYNIQAKEYVDKKSKYRAWMQISQEMNLTISECTKKWKILRDCYRKAVRVRQQMLSAGRPCRRPIKYEKNLKFLVPYLVDRKPPQKKDKTEDTEDPQSLDWNEKITRLYRHFTDSKKLENPIDSFFLTMSRKVKMMPKKIQAEIERDIFRIVNRAEMKLAYDNCSTSAVDLHEYTPTISNNPSSSGLEVEYTPVYMSNTYSLPLSTQIKEEVFDE